MPEKKKGRTCFVPLCKGGYKSFKEKVSLFRALADPVRLQEWARNIKRGDKVLDETCVVCSRHFDDRYIQRTFKHVINGEDVEFDHERPSLTPDAVPTIFPDGPAYLTKPVPRKRKERNIADCTAPPAKRKEPNEHTTSQACEDAAAGEETAQAPHPFHSITPPSAFCSKICLPSNPEALCFAWYYNTVPGDVCVLKHVVFSSSKEVGAADGYLCSTYCRGINVEEHYVSTETDALASLKRADDLLLCCGCEIEPAAGTKCVRFGSGCFSPKCLVTTQDGKACLRCKYLRRLIQNQRNRLKKKRRGTFKQRIFRKSEQLFRAKKKLAKAQRSIEELGAVNNGNCQGCFRKKVEWSASEAAYCCQNLLSGSHSEVDQRHVV
ncbi:hypothetical protein HPB51_013685 [Rhipicephalus microplus]|uniref:THAP-type domain-containing protein n=1 Tax=Rhipicephalus microplus TaxID=6941 RepID=A0A9J6F3B1_RHIMP|nr:hypothetical protein HPB51_013685 [Rhipicephalus microplus]